MGLTPDGIAGKRTREYISDHAAPDASAGSESNDWWEKIEFFTREEFKCKCGGKYCNGYPAEPRELLVRISERARKHFNAPASVVSGLRCRIHNANEGGVANSRHMYGQAVDLRIRGVSVDALLAFMQAQPRTGWNVRFKSRSRCCRIKKEVWKTFLRRLPAGNSC